MDFWSPNLLISWKAHFRKRHDWRLDIAERIIGRIPGSQIVCVGSRVPWSWHYLNHLNNRPWHLICRGQFIVTVRRKCFPIHHVIFSSHGVDIYLVLRNMKQSEAKNHGNVTTIPSITRRDFLMPVVIMFMRPVLMFAQQYTLGIHKPYTGAVY